MEINLNGPQNASGYIVEMGTCDGIQATWIGTPYPYYPSTAPYPPYYPNTYIAPVPEIAVAMPDQTRVEAMKLAIDLLKDGLIGIEDLEAT